MYCYTSNYTGTTEKTGKYALGERRVEKVMDNIYLSQTHRYYLFTFKLQVKIASIEQIPSASPKCFYHPPYSRGNALKKETFTHSTNIY